MDKVKKIMFPYDRVKPNSKVIIYGAGNIGKGIYRENQRSHFCNIIAVADKACGKFIGGIETINPKEIIAIDYDYIILCALAAAQEEMCQQLYDMNVPQGKIICVDSLMESVAEVKECSFMADAFHHLMMEEKYRNISLENHPEMFQWYRNRSNWLIDTDNITKLLLRGYDVLEPVFQIIDKDNQYVGTIDRSVIQFLTKIVVKNIGECTIRDICEECSLNQLTINRASDTSISVCNMYKRFREEPELTEIPLTKDGFLVDVIRRIDFNAFFAENNVTENEAYLSSRYRDWVRIGGLNRFAYNVNSQNGEDGIVEYIFQKIGFHSHFAVEFGGWDGVYLSNIRNLVLKNDMNALFIEGDSQRASEGQKNYAGNNKVKFVNEWVGCKKGKKLDNILKENHVPEEIDLVSIDIDGYDYWIWNSLELYKPRVIIVEFNPTVSNSVVMINPNNENVLHGSSPLALVELGKRKGYELAALTGCNCIFIVSEELEKLDIVDNSLEYLRRESLRDFAVPMTTFSGDVLNGLWMR